MHYNQCPVCGLINKHNAHTYILIQINNTNNKRKHKSPQQMTVPSISKLRNPEAPKLQSFETPKLQNLEDTKPEAPKPRCCEASNPWSSEDFQLRSSEPQSSEAPKLPNPDVPKPRSCEDPKPQILASIRGRLMTGSHSAMTSHVKPQEAEEGLAQTRGSGGDMRRALDWWSTRARRHTRARGIWGLLRQNSKGY